MAVKMILGFRNRLECVNNVISVAINILHADIKCCFPMWRNWDVSLYTRYYVGSKVLA